MSEWWSMLTNHKLQMAVNQWTILQVFGTSSQKEQLQFRMEAVMITINSLGSTLPSTAQFLQ